MTDTTTLTQYTDADWKRGNDMTRRSIAHYDDLVADLEQRLAKARRDREGQVQVLLDGLTNYAVWLSAPTGSEQAEAEGIEGPEGPAMSDDPWIDVLSAWRKKDPGQSTCSPNDAAPKLSMRWDPTRYGDVTDEVVAQRIVDWVNANRGWARYEPALGYIAIRKRDGDHDFVAPGDEVVKGERWFDPVKGGSGGWLDYLREFTVRRPIKEADRG